MKVEIREYEPGDRARLIEIMEAFQDYLANIDGMKRLRRMPEYGESYVDRLLRNVEDNSGVIYLAEYEGQIIGLVAIIIEKQSESDLLECIPSKCGRILELYVEPELRKQGIGKLLIENSEEFAKQQGCDIVRIEVFEPNTNAHHLYIELGYQDRLIDMIKKIPDL